MSDTPFVDLLKRPLSARQARDVARALKGKGYKVTIADCRGRSPVDLVWFCEPIGDNPSKRHKRLLVIIARAAHAALPTHLQFTKEERDWVLQIGDPDLYNKRAMSRLFMAE